MAGRGTDIVLGGMLERLILKMRDDEALQRARAIGHALADATLLARCDASERGHG